MKNYLVSQDVFTTNRECGNIIVQVMYRIVVILRSRLSAFYLQTHHNRLIEDITVSGHQRFVETFV